MTDYPTRPGDIPQQLSLVVLADQHAEHRVQLLLHQHGDQPLPADQIAGRAVAVLATGQALADRALASRWCYAVDALHAGATAEQVGAALGMDADLALIGIAQWAGEQHQLGLITAERHDEVLALVGVEQ